MRSEDHPVRREDAREFYGEPAVRPVGCRRAELYAQKAQPTEVEQLRGCSERNNRHAEAANAADQARIVELRARIDGLELRRLEPQLMRWHG